MNKGSAIVGFLLCFIAGMGLMWGVDRTGMGHAAGSSAEIAADSSSGDSWSDEDAAVPISSKDAMWGNRAAPVTLVLFSDFECPFCGRVEATMSQLKEKYGPEKLRIIWKNSPLPFHKSAKPAAIAAETVFRLGGSKAFWRFHELAFQNQKSLTPENFEQWAVAAGVDKAKWKASFDKQEYAAKLETDTNVGKAAGVSGTPASFINGIFLSGAQPIDKFTEIIDAQLAAAKTALASGTKPSKVYAKLSNDNKGKNPQPDNAKGKDNAPPDPNEVWRVPVGDSPQRGPATALVTIIQWSDYQCPFCSKVEPTIDELRKTYGDKIRIVWKDNPLPFHPRAEPCAEVAREARAEKGDKGYWEAHDMIFKNQQKQADEDLLGYAKELGLDVDKVKIAIKDKKYNGLIAADADLADEFQASGTPHFFVNGHRLVGAQPVEKFKEVIDAEIKKAEALIGKGIAAKDVYNELLKDAKAPPEMEKKTIDPPKADSPWKGGKDAKVVINIFSDFQCPFCKRIEPTLKQVEETYGDKVKFVWRHKPLSMHPDAPLASEAAQEIFAQKGSAGFWKYHDTLFDKQGSSPEILKRPSLEKMAEEQGGIDMAKFKKALDTNVHKAFVDSEAAVGDKAGINGTPACVINGYFINGAQPFAKFKKVIDRAIKDAGVK